MKRPETRNGIFGLAIFFRTFLRLRHERRSGAHSGMLQCGPSLLSGALACLQDGELPAHVSKDFVQLGRFPSDVALPGERELQE